jgi:hypothetical protein
MERAEGDEMTVNLTLPKSAVVKIDHPILSVVLDGVIRMTVGSVVNTTGVIGPPPDPNWELDSIIGPIEVQEVDSEGKRRRYYDISAIATGEARIVFIDRKSGKTCQQEFFIS